MARSTALELQQPHEGALARLVRRVRWAVGLITPADLERRSEAELVSLAEDFVRRGKPKRALVVLGAFTQRTTLDPRILQRYGDVSRALGSHEAAIYSYLQAAELHLGGGMASKASALLMQLVRVYPDHIDARMALARVLEGLQRNKEAAANYAVVVRILEAHGQQEACVPLLQRIAELWPQARADYHGGLSPVPAARPPSVVVGQPSAPSGLPAAYAAVSPMAPAPPSPHVPAPGHASFDDGTGPIELDLQSLISTFALDADGQVHQAATVAVGSYDPRILAAAGHVPSTVCVPEDPWLGARPALEGAPAYGLDDLRTASYAAIDEDRTLMDLRAIDVDTGRDHATADATIADLHAIGSARSVGGARVIDLTETEPEHR